MKVNQVASLLVVGFASFVAWGGASFEIPARLYATAGREANVYFKNVFSSVTPNNYAYEAVCEVGHAQRERWTWTPKAADAGRTVKLVLRAWTDEGCVAEAETEVVVASVPKHPDRKVRLALFADSLTNCGYQNELAKALWSDGFSGYVPIGSRTPKMQGSVPHDGFGGYDCDAFLTRYSVSEDEVARVQDDAERKQLAALGVPVKIVADWQRDILKSPLITLRDGRRTVDVPTWLKRAGGEQPDIVVIQLGVNSVFGMSGPRDGRREQIRKRVLPGFDRLIAALRPYMTNAVFAVTTQPLGCGQDGFGANYGSMRGGGEIQHRITMFELNRALREYVRKRGDPRIELVPLAQQIDPFYGYLHAERPAHARSDEKVVRDDNAVHPSAAGGRQMADALAAWLECRWDAIVTRPL